MPSVISGDANVSATEFGYLDGVTSALQSQMDAKLATATAASTYLPIAGGKILQIVRATDTTNRTTTSTSATDLGLSVVITPQKSDSAILLIGSVRVRVDDPSRIATLRITDSSNSIIYGSENIAMSGLTRAQQTLLAYSTPATTSAITYKLRWYIYAATFYADNASSTAQLYAIEVSA